MPRRQTHIQLSIGIPALVFLFFRGWTLPVAEQWQFIISGVFFIIGGIIPDLFEPAIHYTHRGSFHSLRTLLIVFIGACIFTPIWLFLFRSQYILFIAAFSIGYVIHLLADLTTPMHLPSK